MGLANSLEDVVSNPSTTHTLDVDLSLDGIDDEELDSYIMNDDEFERKNGLWHKHNADYLEYLKSKSHSIKLYLLFYKK